MFSRGSARSGIDTPDISKITYGPEEFWHELAQIVLARFGTTLAPFGTKDLLVQHTRFVLVPVETRRGSIPASNLNL